MSASNTSLLQQMNDDSVRLSKSDKKLSAIILKDPKAIIHLSIAKLASTADVSEPTVNRFCHKLGCDGYPDFKLRLAQEISSTGQVFVQDLHSEDDSSAVMNKIMTAIQNSMQSLAQSLKPEALNLAAEKITKCKSINFFGMGASSSVTLDAQHKFFRLGIPVIAHTDFINQRMSCSMMSSDDVVIFISYSGRTEAMIHNAEIAKQRGAVIIGLTSQGSPLSKLCDVVLNAVAIEDTDLFTPMTSRIIHLAVIDMLAANVAIKLGSSIEENIKSIKQNLITTRIKP